MRFFYVWKNVRLPRIIPQLWGTRLYLVGDTFSVPRYLFSLFRMRRPTTTSYRPILPAAIMLRAFLRF